MKTQILTLVTVAAISFTSCNKDDDQAPAQPKSNLEMLTEDPWQSQLVTTIFYVDGQEVDRVVDPIAGMTTDFLKDGSVISYENNIAVDTSAYALSANNSIVLAGFTGKVLVLTESKLEIVLDIQRDENGLPAHEEIFEFTR